MKNLITLPHWKYSVSWDIKSGALADFLASWENHSSSVVCNEEDGLAILEYSLILIRRHDCQYKTNSCVGSYYPSHNLDHFSSLQQGCTCDFISDLLSEYPLTICFTILGSSE